MVQFNNCYSNINYTLLELEGVCNCMGLLFHSWVFHLSIIDFLSKTWNELQILCHNTSHYMITYISVSDQLPFEVKTDEYCSLLCSNLTEIHIFVGKSDDWLHDCFSSCYVVLVVAKIDLPINSSYPINVVWMSNLEYCLDVLCQWFVLNSSKETTNKLKFDGAEWTLVTIILHAFPLKLRKDFNLYYQILFEKYFLSCARYCSDISLSQV